MGGINQVVGGRKRMLLFGMLMLKLGHTDSLQLLAMAVESTVARTTPGMKCWQSCG
jgi:hypothetical protein